MAATRPARAHRGRGDGDKRLVKAGLRLNALGNEAAPQRLTLHASRSARPLRRAFSFVCRRQIGCRRSSCRC